MNDVLNPPAGRDLPPGRAREMRLALLAATRRPDARRRRLAVALATAVVLAAGAAGTAVTLERRDAGRELLAMGPDELSPSLREAAEQCLRWHAMRPEIVVAPGDLAVAAEQGHRAALLFITPAGYLTCDVTREPGEEVTGGSAGEAWPHRDWLPGPVQRLLLTTREDRAGHAMATGRVSARVARLVLDHGDGHITEARLRQGLFGVITRDFGVTGQAALVAYDAAGREIDRRPLFEPVGCYTDPAGTVVYGREQTGCRPAEPWGR
jgi:hypothetical protein